MAMGGECRIVLYAPDRETARDAAIAAFDRIEAVEQALSDWRADSEVRQVERALRDRPSEPIEISDTLAAAIDRSLVVADASDGAFDPTVAPLVELWRATQRSGVRPADSVVEAARTKVGWSRIERSFGSADASRPTLAAPAGTRFDFGGIGKGFGADEALEVLRERGLPAALVELGGDFAVGAAPPGKAGWTLEIATGLGDERIVLTIAECGVATSGDLERFVEVDGVRYSHLLDPATGLGLTTPIAVTVVAPDAALADGLASAVSVMAATKAAAVGALLDRFAAAARVVAGATPGDANSAPRIATIGPWPE